MNEVTLVILGASGDLSHRKLVPALYRLIKAEKMKKFVIVGAAIDDTTAEAILEKSRTFIKDCDASVWDKMKQHMVYQRLNFSKLDDFKALHTAIETLEKKYNLPGNRLIYCAASANFYCPITQNIADSKLAVRKKESVTPWNRIVYEKPFGHDAVSAHEINDCIKQYFEESQIYRIDHFLTKELVSNIALIRFTNCVFEPLWNNRYIDQVQIVVSESLGIEQRGAYYDAYGALADVMQNHVLELMALIAMESPEKLQGNYVRDKRAEVLKKIEVVDGLRGQFEGYKQEPGVKKDSTMETFAALQLRINNPRWSGVPFYLKTGKCLDKKESVIYIKFKQVDCLLTRSCPVPSNWLKLEISPEEVFSLELNVKKPGATQEVVPVAMEYCHSCLFVEGSPHSYEVVLQEVIAGEKSISVRFDEIEAAWNVIDEVRKRDLPLEQYTCGSKGPEALYTDFEKKHGMRWR